MDVLSLMQIGIKDVVSLPDGAPKTPKFDMVVMAHGYQKPSLIQHLNESLWFEVLYNNLTVCNLQLQTVRLLVKIH